MLTCNIVMLPFSGHDRFHESRCWFIAILRLVACEVYLCVRSRDVNMSCISGKFLLLLEGFETSAWLWGKAARHLLATLEKLFGVFGLYGCRHGPLTLTLTLNCEDFSL